MDPLEKAREEESPLMIKTLSPHGMNKPHMEKACSIKVQARGEKQVKMRSSLERFLAREPGCLSMKEAGKEPSFCPREVPGPNRQAEAK